MLFHCHCDPKGRCNLTLSVILSLSPSVILSLSLSVILSVAKNLIALLRINSAKNLIEILRALPSEPALSEAKG